MVADLAEVLAVGDVPQRVAEVEAELRASYPPLDEYVVGSIDTKLCH